MPSPSISAFRSWNWSMPAPKMQRSVSLAKTSTLWIRPRITRPGAAYWDPPSVPCPTVVLFAAPVVRRCRPCLAMSLLSPTWSFQHRYTWPRGKRGLAEGPDNPHQPARRKGGVPRCGWRCPRQSELSERALSGKEAPPRRVGPVLRGVVESVLHRRVVRTTRCRVAL